MCSAFAAQPTVALFQSFGQQCLMYTFNGLRACLAFARLVSADLTSLTQHRSTLWSATIIAASVLCVLMLPHILGNTFFEQRYLAQGAARLLVRWARLIVCHRIAM